jgi:hypothetical protein
MMDRRSSTVASLLSALLIVGTLAIGGCSSGNIAGPQPDQPTEETITQSDGGVTNDGGTSGGAGHNVTQED